MSTCIDFFRLSTRGMSTDGMQGRRRCAIFLLLSRRFPLPRPLAGSLQLEGRYHNALSAVTQLDVSPTIKGVWRDRPESQQRVMIAVTLNCAGEWRTKK